MLMDINNDRHKQCYWCGQTATSKEHVPPQNLFPPGHRLDLITVDSCSDHNENLSKIDERVRVYLTLATKSQLAKKYFWTKAAKGLQRPESNKLALDIALNYIPDHNGKTLQRVNDETFEKYFEKITRGLLYHHFGIIHRGTISYFSNKMQHLMMFAEVHFYFHALIEDLKHRWIDGGAKNDKVFRYVYYYDKADNRFFVKMTFYEDHDIIVTTLPLDKTINDFGLSFDEYTERQKHWA